MSRDYKPRPDRAPKQSQGNPFVTGLLIGFLLGVAASLAVVMMIKGEESPFADLASPNKPVSEKIADPLKKKRHRIKRPLQKRKLNQLKQLKIKRVLIFTPYCLAASVR